MGSGVGWSPYFGSNPGATDGCKDMSLCRFAIKALVF